MDVTMLKSEVRSPTSLASYFFQQLLVNVEIGVDVLHVVVLFERLHQPDHLSRGCAFEFDVVLRNHRHAGGRRLNPGFPTPSRTASLGDGAESQPPAGATCR